MVPVLPFGLSFAGVRPGGLMRSLHRQLRAAILQERVPAGFLLPSTRRLAGALAISRNTVTNAYSLLVAEGHAAARRGAKLAVLPHAAPKATLAARTSRAHDARIVPAWRTSLPRMVYPPGMPARSFRTGVPEDRHFDHAAWRRLMSRSLRAMARAPFQYGPPVGLPELRAAIAGHVAFARAVVCGPDDLIVTSGAQQAFDFLARMLVVPGKTAVAFENPGFPPTRAAFLGAGARIVPVPLDAEGLRVDRIPDGVKVICVTPSHHQPTGAVMSAQRRRDLLTRARELRAVILEDDYDGEFLYDARPQDALQTLDQEGRVFYVGTFSKSLFPTLRKGFIVAPAWARDALVDIKRASDSHSDTLIQATLAAFIGDGHLARHIRRMRVVYSQRREGLVSALKAHADGWFDVIPGAAGLHLAARTRAAHEAKVIKAVNAHLPGALPLSTYAIGRPLINGVCIGYGCVETEQITRAVRDLGRALGAPRRA
jgi:GntR family transcriptional regulator/MocR family aminotransferase